MLCSSKVTDGKNSGGQSVVRTEVWCLQRETVSKCKGRREYCYATVINNELPEPPPATRLPSWDFYFVYSVILLFEFSKFQIPLCAVIRAKQRNSYIIICWAVPLNKTTPHRASLPWVIWHLQGVIIQYHTADWRRRLKVFWGLCHLWALKNIQ